MRGRCVSTFQLFLTFLKRACGPGAVKNSKISKNMKFLDVRKTNGKTMILRCPDVVLVISFFFPRLLNASCEKSKTTSGHFFVCRRRLDFNFCLCPEVGLGFLLLSVQRLV